MILSKIRIEKEESQPKYFISKIDIELMQHLVKLITFEGQAVLDPFMGSGSTGVACKELNRDFIGYEINKEYYKIAQRRIYDG